MVTASPSTAFPSCLSRMRSKASHEQVVPVQRRRDDEGVLGFFEHSVVDAHRVNSGKGGVMVPVVESLDHGASGDDAAADRRAVGVHANRPAFQ